MTLPDERYNAVIRTRQFLIDLTKADVTPRVPADLRRHALWCLRHYPTSWEMNMAAEKAPDVFQEKMEPVSRLIAQYESSKQNDS